MIPDAVVQNCIFSYLPHDDRVLFSYIMYLRYKVKTPLRLKCMINLDECWVSNKFMKFCIKTKMNLNLLRLGSFHKTLMFYTHNPLMLQSLKNAGLDIHNQDIIRSTPLHYADTYKKAKPLIDIGMCSNILNSNNCNSLHYASEARHLRLLLNNNAEITPDVTGRTPLHKAKTALTSGILLECAKNVDVNDVDAIGCSALHYADTVEQSAILLLCNADVNIIDVNGCTPLHYSKSAEQTQLLLNSKASVNIPDNKGKTALHKALSAEHSKALLNIGSFVNAKDNYSHTPLHESTSLEQTKVLLEHKADINARSWNGKTPLHMSKSAEQTKFLLDNNADVHALDKYDNTPMHDSDSLENTKLLMFYKADVNSVNWKGKTPLHLSSSSEQTKFLLDNHASESAEDYQGLTPLHYSKSYDQSHLLMFYNSELMYTPLQKSDLFGRFDQLEDLDI